MKGEVIFRIAFLVVLIGSLSLLVQKVFEMGTGDKVRFEKVKPGIPVKSSYRFHLIGDFAWKKNNVDHHPVLPVRVVSESMKKFSDRSPIDLIFTTGDNFYPSLDNAQDPDAIRIIDEIFNWTVNQDLPFFFTYGNHDCYTSFDYGDELQVLFSNVYMPKAPFNMTWELGENFIDFVFLSCDLFCLGPIDSHMTRQCKSMGSYNKKNFTEYKWLEKHYEDIKDDKRVLWKIVFVHFPIFSQSTSSGDTEGQKLYLYPILHKYQVDIILSGHNHHMEHLIINNTEEPVPYVKQDYNLECMNVTHVTCPGDEIRMCEFRNVTCDAGKPNCNDRRPFHGFYDRYTYGKNLTFKKGEYLHQIIQGAGGGLLDPLCDTPSPMANLTFAFCDYGFSEIFIDSSHFHIKYIHSNSSTVLFETTILV
jgi:hypothetical protein